MKNILVGDIVEIPGRGWPHSGLPGNGTKYVVVENKYDTYYSESLLRLRLLDGHHTIKTQIAAGNVVFVSRNMFANFIGQIEEEVCKAT